MKQNKYSKEITDLIPLLGGKENIISHTHCVSRIRLGLKDNSKANIKEIEKLENVKATFQPMGQFHIVIGADVNNYYLELINQVGFVQSKEIKNEPSQTSTAKWYQKLLQHFSEIFIPLIPALVAGGLILGFKNILEANWNGENSSLVAMYDFARGLNEFLGIPTTAIFLYIPVAICWSIFSKMKGSQVLGIIIGLSLLLPPLVDISAIKEIKNNLWIFDFVPSFDFGKWSFPWKIKYLGQVLPAIGVAFFGVYLERGLNKITPSVLKQIFVPLVTILLSFTMGLCVIGPIGYIIGSAVTFGLNWTLTHSIAKYFFGPILGVLYGPIVLTGVHTIFNAVMIQDTAQLGGTFIFPIICISNIAQGSACLMFTINNRKNPKIKEIGISSTISAWLGITEPALYGINLKFFYPFLAAMIGSVTGATILTISSVTANGIGNGAWLGILSIQPFSTIAKNSFIGNGYLWFTIGSLVTVAVTMTLTWLLAKLPNFNKLKNDLLNIKTENIITSKINKRKKHIIS